MSVKKYKPRTPSLRFIETVSFDELTKGAKAPKRLIKPLKKTGGRNNKGRITSRHRGGGHKRRYRVIDFKQASSAAGEAKVVSIQYDPNRSGRIALVKYSDGRSNYILASHGLKSGNKIASGNRVELIPGNRTTLNRIPAGMPIFNIELSPGKGGQMVRSAGSQAIIMAKEGNFVNIKLPSGEVRKVRANCLATIGQMSNPDHMNVSLGKAGRSRHLGRRPYSRAVVKNPVDHPMGGGEGRSSGGRHPCSASGRPAKGLKTRKRKKSDQYIVKRRRR